MKYHVHLCTLQNIALGCGLETNICSTRRSTLTSCYMHHLKFEDNKFALLCHSTVMHWVPQGILIRVVGLIMSLYSVLDKNKYWMLTV